MIELVRLFVNYEVKKSHVLLISNGYNIYVASILFG